MMAERMARALLSFVLISNSLGSPDLQGPPGTYFWVAGGVTNFGMDYEPQWKVFL